MEGLDRIARRPKSASTQGNKTTATSMSKASQPVAPNMNKILSLLIVTAVLGVTNRAPHCEAARLPDAVEVFSCDFESEQWDRDFDKWPDLWKRKRGIEYPHYVNIGIVNHAEELAARAAKRSDEVGRGKNGPAKAGYPDAGNHGIKPGGTQQGAANQAGAPSAATALPSKKDLNNDANGTVTIESQESRPQDPRLGKECLKITVNGGAAVVESPPIPVRSLFSYVLEGMIRTEGLKGDETYLSLTFFDEDNNRLETAASQRFRITKDWQEIRVGPLSSEHTSASYAIISLHLVPSTHADLTGAVYLDDVWFARLPRLVLSTNSAHNVYTDFDGVEITCEVSGILERDPMMKFEVVDVFSKAIARTEHRLEGKVVAEKSSSASEAFATKVQRQAGFAGTAKWKPSISDYGYYQVRVALYARGEKGGQAKLIDEEKVSFAVVRSAEVPSQGEFGWTLPGGDDPVPLAALEQLVSHVGINWLKFPVWYSETDTGRPDKLVRFAERLSLSQIELIGLLHAPPPELAQHYGNGSATAADIFASDAQVWTPSLEAVMTRLSLKIRWWQLGLDQDHSFVNYPNLPAKIASIKKDLYKFGQEAFVGIGWRWINEPIAGEVPWRFLSLSASPELTPEDLQQYLQPEQPPEEENETTAASEEQTSEGRNLAEAEAAKKAAERAAVIETQAKSPLRWVVVEPLPRGQYDQETRATDLIHRMLSAKMAGADGIFIPNPFSTQRGLMNDDGTPGELLLPWRTTALSLAGTEYLGSIRMPSGSSNHIFTRDGEATMVIWNETPTEEQLYLGDNVQITDIWGRITDLSLDEGDTERRQKFTVGPLPIFIKGVNEPIIRMRMSFRFAREQLPSVFGKSHDQGIHLQNFFPSGIQGKVRMNTPDVWRVPENEMDISMAGGEILDRTFQIELPFDANTGRQEIKVDFDIEADRNYKFSVFRHIDIGLGDVVVDVVTSLDKKGNLEVQQHLTNHTDEPLSFTCTLFAPNRRRMRTQVLQLERGTDTRTYRLSNGAELIDKKILLRLEEVDGQRVLNYRITVKQ